MYGDVPPQDDNFFDSSTEDYSSDEVNGFSTSYAASPPPASAPRPPPSASYPKPPPRNFSRPFRTSSSPPQTYTNAPPRSSQPFHDSSQQSPRDAAPPLPPRYAKHFASSPSPQSRSYSPPEDYPQPQPPASPGRQESGFAPSPPSYPPPRQSSREDDGCYSDSYNEGASQFGRDDFDSLRTSEVLPEKRPNSEQYFPSNDAFSRSFDPASSLPSLSSQNTRETSGEGRRHHVFSQPDPYDIFKRFFGTNDFNQAASMRFVSFCRHP